jgi:hypothetical protein
MQLATVLFFLYIYGRERMVVGFTTTYAISAAHHELPFIDSDLLYIEVSFIDSDLLYIELPFIDSDLLCIELPFIDTDLLYANHCL